MYSRNITVVVLIACLVSIVAGCGGSSNNLSPPAAAGSPGGANTSPAPVSLFSVSTFAGSGLKGSVDGVGSAASFWEPKAIAIDGQGNLYVADYNNQSIRKITSSGVVTTLAGSGASGHQDGPGVTATFTYSLGLTVDLNGNVYVADSANNAIRKITVAGDVTTLAGGAGFGFANGNGAAAKFNFPHDIAVSPNGNLYVTDFSNNVIRKITRDGTVSTYAGTGIKGAADGPAATASFNNPSGIAVDAQENLYIGDYGNNLIRKISVGGIVSTIAGNGTAGNANGTGTFATFTTPASIAIDGGGNLYVPTAGNQIRIISPAGVVSTFAGTGAAGMTNGPALSSTFNLPLSVAVGSNGTVYVADTLNNAIRKITPN